MMKLSKAQREEAINKLKKSTSIAKYAFYEALKNKKITDEQLLKMVEYSDVMAMLKPVIDTNRGRSSESVMRGNLENFAAFDV